MTKRKTYRAHPMAKLVPGMSARDFSRLKSDIEKAGCIHEPIWLYEGKILDGRHRYRATAELGIDCPTRDYTGDDPESFVMSENLARRHLSQSQQRALVAARLKHSPEKSDRQIAFETGVTNKTVGVIRAALVKSEEIPHFPKRTDSRTGRQSQPTSRGRVIKLKTLVTRADLLAKRVVHELDDIERTELSHPESFIEELQKHVTRLSMPITPTNCEDANHG